MPAEAEKRSPFPGLATDAAAVRQRVEALEGLLERLFVIPGTNRQVGLDVILDLVPFLGSTAGAAIGAYLFGAITIAQLHIQATNLADLAGLPGPLYWLAGAVKSVPSQFLSALPYLATVVVLVLISRNRRLTMMNTPASLGRPFVPDR